MIINYSDSDVILEKPSIFLAGPTVRKEDEASWNKESWRKEAIKILKDINFKGVVYIPEYEKMKGFIDKDEQFEWEWTALHASSIILFWVPRKFPELPAMTTNVEFGFYLKSDKPIVYGRPDDADKNGYLDRIYKKVLKKTPFNNLKSTIEYAVNTAQKITPTI